LRSSSERGSSCADRVEDVAQAKAAVRRQMRARRRVLSGEARARASASVCSRLAADPAIAHATETPGRRGAIAVYLASPDEIDLSPFIREMLGRGATVVSPRWNGESYDLARIAGLSDGDLRKGPMNIPEPAAAETVEPGEVAVWILPGLAFTTDGKRLGYGGGWYDRLLAAAGDDAVKIGVAHDFQVVDDLPVAAHDIFVDRVVTDRELSEDTKRQ